MRQTKSIGVCMRTRDDEPIRTGRAGWPERLDQIASLHPDAPAVSSVGVDSGNLTWGNLSQRSLALAGLLEERGVAAGSVVAVELPNGLAHVLTTVAAWRLGATVLPLRPSLPAPERERLLGLAAPSLLVSSSPDADLSAGDARDPAGPPPSAPAGPRKASPAWMIASGGSTGLPKLVAAPVDAELGSGSIGVLDDTGSVFGDSSGHRHPVHLVCAPLSHTHALSLLYFTLLNDFRVILTERFDAEQVLDLIESRQVSFVGLVPTMLIRILKSPSFDDRRLSSLECVLVGAGASPEWAVRALAERIGPSKVLLGYGSSEGIGAALISGDEWLAHPGSVGRPTSFDVRVVGDDGRDLAPGEIGELYFRPKATGRSFRYVGAPSARSLPGGFLSLGDLGWLDVDGYLYIADRRSDMVVTGGANVYVAEVEAVLLEHPAVEDVVVIGIPDEEWGRRVHAIVAPRPGADPATLADDLRRFAAGRVAPYKVPKTFELVERLERSEAGKVNRRALAEERTSRLPSHNRGAP
jgi:bile acid-coenzyme A ligase